MAIKYQVLIKLTQMMMVWVAITDVSNVYEHV